MVKHRKPNDYTIPFACIYIDHIICVCADPDEFLLCFVSVECIFGNKTVCGDQKPDSFVYRSYHKDLH